MHKDIDSDIVRNIDQRISFIGEYMIRLADNKDLEAINELRRQVNDIHVNGRPDIFKPGFCKELEDHAERYLSSDNSDIFVDEQEGKIAGMVMVDYISKPESPYGFARDFCHIAEICVDKEYRRRGIAHSLIERVKEETQKRGLSKIELDVWAFNDAATFYEAEGFKPFRTFLEYDV